MKLKRWIALCTAAVMAAAVLTGCGEKKGANTTADVDGGQVKTLTVGFDQNFPPMGFKAEDGSFTGFDLELAEEAAKRMGMEVKYRPIEWDAKDMELESGTIDCIWNGFSIQTREDDYTWTEPYMKNNQVIVVRTADGIGDFAGLTGKAVVVQADSTAEKALADKPELTKTFGKLNPVADYNTAFMELESGAADAIAMDSVVAQYQIKDREDEFKILDEIISVEDYGVGVKKGNTELRDKIQNALEEMAADGTLASTSEKWFGEDVTIIGK